MTDADGRSAGGLGAEAYGLKSIEYCIDGVLAPAFITEAKVIGGGPFSEAIDGTDRAAAGCHTVVVNSASSGFILSLDIDGGGAGRLLLGRVTSTWAPAGSLTP